MKKKPADDFAEERASPVVGRPWVVRPTPLTCQKVYRRRIFPLDTR
jgi:hypothetical protein